MSVKIHLPLLTAVVLNLLTACSSLRESPKYQFVDDIYRARLKDKTSNQSFLGRATVIIKEDSITGISLQRQKDHFRVDSSQLFLVHFPPEHPTKAPARGSFAKNSFDLDFVSTPIKFRPATGQVPAQLNAYLNGSVFVGHRIDYFKLSYRKKALGTYSRQLRHYGLSFGGFSGLGATGVNPTTTEGRTQQEYDGIVWQNGVAMIVGIDTFTFGIGLGLDKLTDPNHQIWVYQNRLWVGLTLGLNLN